MQKNGEKKTLFTGPKYVVVLCLFFILLTLAIVAVGLTLEMAHRFLIVFPGIVLLLILGGLMVFSIQTAVLDGEGVLFRFCWFRLAFVRWEDLRAVERDDVTVADIAGFEIKKDFIVLRTIPRQTPRRGGINRKDPPWVIKTTPKNVAAVREYAEKYAKNAEIFLW